MNAAAREGHWLQNKKNQPNAKGHVRPVLFFLAFANF